MVSGFSMPSDNSHTHTRYCMWHRSYVTEQYLLKLKILHEYFGTRSRCQAHITLFVNEPITDGYVGCYELVYEILHYVNTN